MREVKGHGVAALRVAGCWVATVLALMPGLAVAASWLDFPLPPRSQAQWVVQEGRVNGLPARILEIDSELSAEELLGFYREQFRRSGALVQATRSHEGWRGLSMMRDKLQVLAQVKSPSEPGRTRVLLSQMDIGSAADGSAPNELPNFQDAVLAQTTETRDGARRSRFLNYLTSSRIEHLRRIFQGHAIRHGWQTVFDDVRVFPSGQQWLASYAGPAGLTIDVVVGPMAGKTAMERLSMSINLIDTKP